jgi:hypothetical protein
MNIYYEKYLKYKSKYIQLQNILGGVVKRKGVDSDPSTQFQNLINCIGTDTILQDFASFLGRDNCEISTKSGKTRRAQLPHPNFTGIAFAGAHWKGYENGKETYDSYSTNIQLDKTNNYCQSYACFLWASQGLFNAKHNITLISKDYAVNVQKISALWLKYFEDCLSNKYMKDWLYNAIKNDDFENKKEIKDRLDRILLTLQNLKDSIDFAREFSQSAE